MLLDDTIRKKNIGKHTIFISFNGFSQLKVTEYQLSVAIIKHIILSFKNVKKEWKLKHSFIFQNKPILWYKKTISIIYTDSYLVWKLKLSYTQWKNKITNTMRQYCNDDYWLTNPTPDLHFLSKNFLTFHVPVRKKNSNWLPSPKQIWSRSYLDQILRLIDLIEKRSISYKFYYAITLFGFFELSKKKSKTDRWIKMANII
jgi:hypothetical protein